MVTDGVEVMELGVGGRAQKLWRVLSAQLAFAFVAFVFSWVAGTSGRIAEDDGSAKHDCWRWAEYKRQRVRSAEERMSVYDHAYDVIRCTTKNMSFLELTVYLSLRGPAIAETFECATVEVGRVRHHCRHR